jgi:hypothetical protein
VAIGFSVRRVCVILTCFLLAMAASSESKVTLQLRGVVPPRTTVTVRPEPEASSLALGQGASELKVATVSEVSNCSGGYSVSISTENGGVLKGATSGRKLAYSMSYDGKPVAFAAGSATVSSPSSVAPGGVRARELAISFEAADLEADDYSDTVTLIIAAK